MRQYAMLTVVALVLMGALTGPASAGADTIRVTAERVDILAEPNAASRVLATASRGTILEVLRREGAWCVIR